MGSILLSSTLFEIRDRGVSTVFLLLTEGKDTGLYRNSGFRETGRHTVMDPRSERVGSTKT